MYKVKVKVGLRTTLPKCEKCEYTCKLNIQMKKHMEKEHSETTSSYRCDLCDFRCDFLLQIWNHKLDHHGNEIFNIINMDEHTRKNLMFNLVAEQNADLMVEVTNMKEVFNLCLFNLQMTLKIFRMK